MKHGMMEQEVITQQDRTGKLVLHHVGYCDNLTGVLNLGDLPN